MNETIPKIPSSIDINAYRAYCTNKIFDFEPNKPLNAFDLKWTYFQPKSLRILVLDMLIENWNENPVFDEIKEENDRIYILDNMDLNMPIKLLSANIKDDIFWKRSFRNRWPNYFPKIEQKTWMILYMEKYLAETLENLDPCDYDQEGIQTILDFCSSYINFLEINYLQPSIGERTDHIPFDFILSNLPELKSIRITFLTKTIETNFYLGCSSISKNDINLLSKGLQKCYELTEFSIHSSKLDPYMMKIMSRALEAGCSNLEIMSITHTRFGDRGLYEFVNCLSKDAFSNIKQIILTNNLLSREGALCLSKTIRGRQIELLDVRLNPIGTEGAAALLFVIPYIPIKILNLSGCSIDDGITRMLIRLIIENKTLQEFDLSNNELGEDLGRKIFQVIGFNKTLKTLDLRYSNISSEFRNRINTEIFKNKSKNNI